MKEVTLIFQTKELLYDISNYSYVESDIIPTDNEHIRHQVSDVCESGNIDRVRRILELSHKECVEMLYPYSKQEVCESSVYDNSLIEKECYCIELKLPNEFSQTTIELLQQMLHEYMVCRVMSDWMSITNGASTEKWVSKLSYIGNKIPTMLLSRTSKLKRKQGPF